MKPASLRARFLIAAAVVVSLALLAAAWGLSRLFETHVKSWIDGELEAHMTQLIAGIDATADADVAVVTPPGDPRFERPFSGLYWQIAIDGRDEPLRSRSLWDFAIALPADATIHETLQHHAVAGPQSQQLYLLQRYIELPARLSHHKVRVAVAIDDAQVTSAVWRFTGALMPLLALLGCLLIAAAWVQVSVGLHPLASIRSRIAAIRSGAANRLGQDFPTEVQPLAQEIDVLLDARDAQIEKARTAAADLAHGLKTPLQVMAGGIAKLKHKGDMVLASDFESARHVMQRHVDRHLARARTGGGRTAATADIARVAANIVRVLERSPDGERLEWGLDIPAGLSARIHADDLSEALGGIAENAARHAKTKVALRAESEGRETVITVEDDGPGIAQEQIAEALRRGGRLDTSGAGSGLGLSIVDEIAQAWGGRLTFDKSESAFAVRLHLPQPDSAINDNATDHAV